MSSLIPPIRAVTVFDGLQGQAIESGRDMYVQCEGLEYGAWARTPHNPGDLIENPVGMIESVIRDWKHREIDMEITSIANPPPNLILNMSDLRFNIANYYIGAYFYNITNNWTDSITGSSTAKQVTFAPGGGGISAAGDKCFITNINCNIDNSTFDAVEAVRSDWKFARGIASEITTEQALRELCFESHTALIYSMVNGKGGYKLAALDTGTELATLGRPLHFGGEPQMRVALGSPLQLYNEFRLEYAFDFGSKSYVREAFVNKNGSSNATDLGSTYQDLCRSVENNDKISQPFIYQSDWIYEEATANKFLQKMVVWNTQRKLTVRGTWEIQEVIQYERGDLLKINFPARIPASKNNSAIFMVTGKNIIPTFGATQVNPGVELTLSEIL